VARNWTYPQSPDYDPRGQRTSVTVTGYALAAPSPLAVTRTTTYAYGGDPACPSVPLNQLCQVNGPCCFPRCLAGFKA